MGKSRSMELLHRLFLEDPETGERLRIIHVEGNEAGHDHLRVIAQGARGREEGLAWEFKVFASETTWPEAEGEQV